MDKYYDEIKTFGEFMEDVERNTIYYDPYILLKDFKYDGRKYIELTDLNNKTLRIKCSIAKKIFPFLIVISSYEELLTVNAKFQFDI